MKINITTKNIDLTPAISEYIDKKVGMVEKFINKEASEILAMVEVGKSTMHHKSGDVFRAEIHITANGGDFYAAVEKDDLYAAIDAVKDEIVRELTSRRKKALKLLRRGGAQLKSIIKRFKF